MIRSLYATGRPDRRTWGDKAFNLYRMTEFGVAVPDAFVIPGDRDLPTSSELSTALRSMPGIPSTAQRFPVAVRSSALGEDTAQHSLAGSFLTVLGEMTVAEVDEAISSVRRSGGGRDVGVIVQRLVDCAFAGVAFSMNPMTFSRESLLVAATTGRGDGLVSGHVQGSSWVLPRFGDVPSGDEGMFRHLGPHLAALRDVCLRIEAEWATPVDVEWAIETGSGRLWLLQARPVVLPAPTEVELSSTAAIDSLPAAVLGHSKIALRRNAAKSGVAMSRATALVVTGAGDLENVTFVPSARSAGLSVVLLLPERVEDGVVREFAPAQGEDVEFFTRECRRYAIRRYPRHSDLTATVGAVVRKGLDATWMTVCIVQEIYDAPWTGILRKIDGGFLVEIAQGHFVPKGVVQTSRYILDFELRITDRDCPSQEFAYRFADGHVLQEARPEAMWPSDETLSAGVAQLLPIFDEVDHGALEFGLLDNEGGVSAYLIDIAEGDREEIVLDHALISSGVISPGRVDGQLAAVGEYLSEQAIDAHLHDSPQREVNFDRLIFLAERASTDLLPLIYQCSRGTAFVFTIGSVLGHVGVVLRELGIPAVIVDRTTWQELAGASSAAATLDAVSPHLSASDRISLVG